MSGGNQQKTKPLKGKKMFFRFFILIYIFKILNFTRANLYKSSKAPNFWNLSQELNIC